LNNLWVVWLLSAIFLRLYAYFPFQARRFIAKPLERSFGTPKIIFQITTKGNIPVVQETVDRIHAICNEIGYSKYEVCVVTDAQESFENCRTIVVPEDYSCNAADKGRALQYAVELRKREKKNKEDIFIFHLDDESLVSKQTLYSILSYLEQSPTPISEGLITYPLQRNEKIRLTHLFDALRPFCCFECVHYMSNGKPAYIHGSNLLVRSDMEEKVGWDNGKTLAEDTLFALKAKNKLGTRAFGWHGGVLEERSPYTLRDLVKQRKRWFYGLMQNLRYISTSDRLNQALRAVVWFSGFPSGIVSILAFFIPQEIPTYLNTALIFLMLLWLGSYQIGAFLNGKNLPRARRLTLHLLTLLFTPVAGLVECSIPILALVSKPRAFEVVEKRPITIAEHV
jgi:egghead protein (zeste-white 4 protein)